ncbi:unnamed protein product, partial [Mesorhabditis spiculigera]
MAWCAMFAIDFAVNDGVLFFTRELEGRGQRISACLSVFVVCSLVEKLLCPHVLWQLVFVSYVFFLVYLLLMRIFVYKNDASRKIMIPSAITIAVFCTFIGICEMWWLFIMVDALLYDDQKSSRRTSDNEYPSRPHNHRQGIDGVMVIMKQGTQALADQLKQKWANDPAMPEPGRVSVLGRRPEVVHVRGGEIGIVPIRL